MGWLPVTWANKNYSSNWPAGFFPVRGLMSVSEVLVGDDGVVVLDTAVPGDGARIRRKIERLGIGSRDVRAIL